MPRFSLIFFLSLLTLTAVAADALADINAQPIITDLGSESYTVRQHATESLFADDTLSPEDIQKLYTAATLPEQRHRLLDVALHHFVRRAQQAASPQEGTKSMLGVGVASAPEAQQIPDIGHPALRIDSTYPGYPAYVALRPGDLIVSFNDQPLPDTSDLLALREKFIEQVQANAPGAAVRLGVYRDGKLLTVTLRLAGTDLGLFYEVGSSTLRPPYDAQWQQVRLDLMNLKPDREPLKTDLKPAPARNSELPLHLNQQPPDENAAED